jgi:membrane protease YdiL (CAAX protease family)
VPCDQGNGKEFARLDGCADGHRRSLRSTGTRSHSATSTFRRVDQRVSPRNARADLVATLTLLVGLNLANAFVLDGWLTAPGQGICAALAVLGARQRGYSWEELGLARRNLPAGLRLGGGMAAVIVTGVALVALVPTTRSYFEDERFLDVSAGRVIYEIAFRIPLVTALTEELLFRSVLLAVLLVTCSRWRAVAMSSLLFGLWHVFTALGDLDENEATADFVGWEVIVGVVGVVAATAAAGVVFAWLRLRSGSVVAPWLVHAVLNASTFSVGAALVT